MKKLDKIPTSKTQRAAKMLKVGTGVGANYVKYWGKKLVSDKEKAKEELNEANAEVIYDGLSELKGSALKVAQMMSMDQSILPKAFVEKFSLAQFQVPPLSAPLARKVLTKELGKSPEEIYDKFDYESRFAASIGQVHEAWKDGQKLAVKLQYPGVAKSIGSDLQLVKPVAMRMFNLKKDDVAEYFEEVENKLKEETNYVLELQQLQDAIDSCTIIPNLTFPKPFESLSTQTVLTMEWKEGKHLSEYDEMNPTLEQRNQIAQTLWDFYLYQIHELRKVHADPHPGNFMVSPENELIALDFGCVKALPDDFYNSYFKLIHSENITNRETFVSILKELDVITESDTAEEQKLLADTFERLLTIVNKPFQSESFDFSSPEYFHELMLLGTELKDQKELRKLSGKRGSRHFLYVNRTLFGLLGLMNALNAGPVDVHHHEKYLTRPGIKRKKAS
ncbi:AarF/ABC1/UbiB kinase family protein [Crocinitomicaceae bacterium]|nr:AarF/ABC1/UbiB kinase family protein [Crocinitomicaceae bacterium]MDB3906133.1 AarF/ABC1/UbiB kinase family protein [Crocinitomicaceae bacterium]